MKNTRVRTFYKPERKAEVIDELNGKPTKEIGLGFAIMIGILITIFIGVVKNFGEWIDSKGHIVMLVFALIGLVCFAYWALVGRKK